MQLALACPQEAIDSTASTTVSLPEDSSHAEHRKTVDWLYRTYSRKAYLLAWGYLRDREEALEVTQEAFIRVQRGLPKFEGRSSHYSWLFRVVANMCIDRRRRRHRWANTLTKIQPPVEPLRESLGGADPEFACERGQFRAVVEECLEQLNDAQRTAIVMREVQGLTYAEIAETMGCKLGTVMSRLFHARRRMRELLSARDWTIETAA